MDKYEVIPFVDEVHNKVLGILIGLKDPNYPEYQYYLDELAVTLGYKPHEHYKEVYWKKNPNAPAGRIMVGITTQEIARFLIDEHGFVLIPIMKGWNQNG